MVSNTRAPSDRSRYVAELQKYIKVEVIGKDQNIDCPRSQDVNCSADIGRQYKFYLAFESSVCSDYITEKLYKYYNLDIVLVVRGTPGYLKVAPRNTFINTADFNSPKDLAERLLYLDSHHEEYIDILKEKSSYFSIYEEYKETDEFLSHRYEAVSFCHLCHRLWNPDVYRGSVVNVYDWLNKSHCET